MTVWAPWQDTLRRGHHNRTSIYSRKGPQIKRFSINRIIPTMTLLIANRFICGPCQCRRMNPARHCGYDTAVFCRRFHITRLQQIQNSLARVVVKTPKCCYITPILHSLHWLKITERIEYKLLSFTCKVLTTTQPPYLHKLISVQPPRNTRSSCHVTLARPPTSSSLRITDRSFRYASPCLWNQLPNSLRQPHFSPSVSDFPADAPVTSSYSLNLPLSPSITLSLIHI